VLDKALLMLSNKKWIRSGEWNFKDIEQLNKHNFITVIIIINLLMIIINLILKKRLKI
jgi:obg-like ATPase 1